MSQRLICAALLGGLMIAGCEKTEDATAPAADAAKSAADSAKSAAGDAADATKSAAGTAAEATKSAAGTAVDATKSAAGATADAAKSATPAPAAAPAADATAAAPAAAPAGATAEAQKLLDQAMTYVKENKLDLADKTLTQLEGMKSTLPASMQSAVDNARKAFSAAKATGGGLSVPALPK